jgi:formylglycine-generating enzyme required for sulfatase activity
MVRVAGGSFPMGAAAGEGAADERPQHQVTLSAYCIDRTEVTVAAYRGCVDTGRCSAAGLESVSVAGQTDAERPFWAQFCTWPASNRAQHPLNCVDWTQADTYCRAQGARLPTEAEWEFAARGTDGRSYPWGNQAPGPTLLNACGAECAAMSARLGRNLPTMYAGDDGWGATAPAGHYTDGASPSGVLDMAGNVWEWTGDWYGSYGAEEARNPTGAVNGTERVLRGGSWSANTPAAVRATVRRRGVPTTRSSSLGFRCVREAS